MMENTTMFNTTAACSTNSSQAMVNMSNITTTTEIYHTTSNQSSYNTTNSTQAPGKSLYDYEEYTMSLDMYPIHTFIFVIGGMAGNLLALCVILRKNMRGMSSSVFIASLAVADNVALLGFLLGMVSLIYARHIIDRGFCTVYFFLTSLGSMISSWTVVAMSFERVLIVTFPLKAPNWTSRKKAIAAEIIIIIAILLHNSHFFWTAMKDEKRIVCQNNHIGYGDFLSAWSIYDATMSSYTPLILILIMNFVIIMQIKRARSIQKSMSNAPGGEKQGKAGSGSGNATNQITIMLLSVSIAFFICMTPYSFFQIYINYIVNFQTISLLEYARVSLANQFCLILWETNHSINVVLYSLTGRKFRNEMLALFTCGGYEARPRSATYATDATRTTNMRATNGATSMTSVNTVSAVV